MQTNPCRLIKCKQIHAYMQLCPCKHVQNTGNGNCKQGKQRPKNTSCFPLFQIQTGFTLNLKTGTIWSVLVINHEMLQLLVPAHADVSTCVNILHQERQDGQTHCAAGKGCRRIQLREQETFQPWQETLRKQQPRTQRQKKHFRNRNDLTSA